MKRKMAAATLGLVLTCTTVGASAMAEGIQMNMNEPPQMVSEQSETQNQQTPPQGQPGQMQGQPGQMQGQPGQMQGQPDGQQTPPALPSNN